MELFVCIAVETADGRQPHPDVMAGLADELDNLEFDVGESVYSCTVTGMASTMKALAESRKRRRIG